jgi:hypothetical protein
VKQHYSRLRTIVPTHEQDKLFLDDDLRTDNKHGLALYVLFSRRDIGFK